jgi:hemerythrin superfamily protein
MSTGMKDPTNALDLLTSQHAEVDRLIGGIEHAEGAHKLELFREVADNLAAHCAIEERLFYPAVKAKQTEGQLHEAVEEHLEIKRLLADMLELDVDDDEFEAKLAVVKENLEHHAHEEEERKLFPKVRKMLSPDQLSALGGEMLAMFEELIVTGPRNHIPRETDQAAAI